MIQKLDELRQPLPVMPRKVHYRTPESDLPRFEFQGELTDCREKLESWLPAWSRLMETAIHPNPFFDPDFLIPAFKHLQEKPTQVLAIHAPNRLNPDAEMVLCGLFPVVRKRFYGLPLSCLEVWKHDQCFDSTPLIRKDCAKEVFSFVLDYLARETRTQLFSLDTVVGEGEFQTLLTEVLHQRSQNYFHRDAFNRACFISSPDPETFLRSKVSTKTRKNTKRLERKLAKQGKVHFETLPSGSGTDLEHWTKEFLDLEASGWKGKNRSALGSDSQSHLFFHELVRRNVDNGKLAISKLTFDGKPICMFCDLHQRFGGAHFKTSFDEAFSSYSPGLIAELHNIERLHLNGVQSMDSCAAPNHSMINRVWPDRTRLQSI